MSDQIKIRRIGKGLWIGAVACLLTSAVDGRLAVGHPGHGAEAGESWAHYFLDPAHGPLQAACAAGMMLILWGLYSRLAGGQLERASVASDRSGHIR